MFCKSFTGTSSYEKTQKTPTNETQVYVYTCKSDGSNMEKKLQCNKTFKIYYSNKTIYLTDSKHISTGYYECAIDENDAFQNITSSSDMELVSKCLIFNYKQNIHKREL